MNLVEVSSAQKNSLPIAKNTAYKGSVKNLSHISFGGGLGIVSGCCHLLLHFQFS